MSEKYIKLLSPIRNGDEHIYPLTTYDQIILEDGSRWNGETIPEIEKILRYDAEQQTGLNNFVKTTLPPRVGDQYLYFPTSADQIIFSDGTKLENNGIIPWQLKKVSFSITFSSDAWDTSSLPYIQTVIVEDAKSSDDLKADVDLSSATPTTFDDLTTAWHMIDRIVVNDGSITAYCYKSAPNMNVTVHFSGLREGGL